jgi:hypothetical protein
MPKIALAITLGLLAVVGTASAANAQCYKKQGGSCVVNGSKGRDSTCHFRCTIGVSASGEKVVKIYKHGHWQVQPQ